MGIPVSPSARAARCPCFPEGQMIYMHQEAVLRADAVSSSIYLIAPLCAGLVLTGSARPVCLEFSQGLKIHQNIMQSSRPGS